MTKTRFSAGRAKDRSFFQDTMAIAFADGKRVVKEGGIGAVVFAHQTTEGWEALLSGMIRGGWIITASWPVATEHSYRLRAMESAALATSVHLVCRPREEDAPVGEWAEVLQELPPRVGDWMQRLQKEGIRGADLVFACIGPALEIYSRYSGVETPEGSPSRTLRIPRERSGKSWPVRHSNKYWGQPKPSPERCCRRPGRGCQADRPVPVDSAEYGRRGTRRRRRGRRLRNRCGGRGPSSEGNRLQPATRRSKEVRPTSGHPPRGMGKQDHPNPEGSRQAQAVNGKAKELFGEAGADNMADEIEASLGRVGPTPTLPRRGTQGPWTGP